MARSWVSMCFLSLKDTTLLCAVPGPSTLPTPGCTFSPGFDLHLIILQNSADTPVLLAVFPDLPRWPLRPQDCPHGLPISSSLSHTLWCQSISSSGGLERPRAARVGPSGHQHKTGQTEHPYPSYLTASARPLPRKAWPGPQLCPSGWAGLWLSPAFWGGVESRTALCHLPSRGRGCQDLPIPPGLGPVHSQKPLPPCA